MHCKGLNVCDVKVVMKEMGFFRLLALDSCIYFKTKKADEYIIKFDFVHT